MKNKYLLLLLFFGSFICISPSCKKHNPDPDPLSLLPPATQTGANTFGCLVNGQALVAKNTKGNGQSPTQCNYIYTNGGYYFTVAGSDDSNKDYIVSAALNTTLLAITEGQIIKLENRNEAGKACGLYSLVYNNTQPPTWQTTVINGQMHIVKFDQVHQIVSGTFDFNAINLVTGEVVSVTNGRFDMKYTQ
jgi:hypothetical protein